MKDYFKVINFRVWKKKPIFCVSRELTFANWVDLKYFAGINFASGIMDKKKFLKFIVLKCYSQLCVIRTLEEGSPKSIICL